MRKKNSFRWIVFCFILLSIFLQMSSRMGVTQTLYPAPEEDVTITVGALLPLTGSLSSMGETARVTLQVTETDIETVYPRVHLEIVIEDTASDPAIALLKLQSLVERGIRMIIGPFSSAEVWGVKSYADAHDCILISPTSTAPSLSLDDHIFRITTSDLYQTLALATFIQAKGVEHIIPLVRNDQYGRDFIEAFQTNFQEIGTMSDPIFYDGTTTNFQDVITQVNHAAQTALAEKPQASIGILAVSFDEIIPIFQTASNHDLLKNLRWFGTDTTAENPLIAQDGIAATFAAQVQFTASVSSTIAWCHPFAPFSISDEILLLKIYPIMSAPNKTIIAGVFDALWLSAMIQFHSPANLKEELSLLSQIYVGLKGNISFDKNGDCSDIMYCLFQFDPNRTWAVVGSYKGFTYDDGSLTHVEFSDKALYWDGTDKTAKIGVLLSLTGSYAETGQRILSTLQTSYEEINAILRNNYTPHSSIELIVEDTESDPAIALQKIMQLHDQGIRFVIGPLTSAELESVSAYAVENEMIIISPTSTASSLNREDTIFRLMLNDRKQSKALAALIMDQHYTQAVVLYRNDTYGAGFYQDFKSSFELLGNPAVDGVPYDVNTTDFTPIIQQLEAIIPAQNRNATAIVLVSYDEAADIMSAIPENSILAGLRWFGTDSTALNSIIAQNAGAAAFADRAHFTASIMSIKMGWVYMVSDYAFFHEMTNRLGGLPRASDVAAYEAAWLYFTIFSGLDWEPTPDLQQILDVISAVTNQYSIIGVMSNFMFDAGGDREYGVFDFYQFRQDNEPGEWTHFANYLFDFISGEETLIYTDQPVSSTGQWELYP
ncbi:MAG: hypothetical protein C4527_18120 [Candidatus Omnitrophota bacterium]|nr:MAG: hypothetical protein C4527_18120 [Candidatus Omnitrophota bacterium]